MKLERTAYGKIELRLSQDSNEFHRLAEQVREKLGGQWSQQLDHHDQSYWDLECRGTKITVHREHYLGVFVLCDDTAAQSELLEQLLREIGTISGEN
jgi:hypothetical protein